MLSSHYGHIGVPSTRLNDCLDEFPEMLGGFVLSGEGQTAVAG